MQQTRQRILDFLEKRGSASPKQLAKAFGMTTANIRHHLDVLSNETRITVVGLRPAERRGRPEQIFTLVQQTDSKLDPLARALLSSFMSKEGSRSAARVAEKLLGEQPAPSGQVTQRLVAAVRRLEPLGYKPRWEARPQGPQMVLGLCPYAAIIADHPELCRIDAHMLEILLGAPMEQTAKLQPGPQQIPQCVFVMKKTQRS